MDATTNYKEAQQFSSELLRIIAKKELSAEEKTQFVYNSIAFWNEHINPGFLQYRKSVSDNYKAVEWSDHGNVLRDINGREFIDLLGGFGIYNVGHRHPKVLAAVQAQLNRQALHSQELVDGLRPMLGRLLAMVTPKNLQYSFFTNSGTESVEAGIKFAMLATGRKHIVAAIGGFHGKTLGALSATSKAVFRGPFLPLLNVTHVRFGDVENLRAVLECNKFSGNDVAGEGGIHVMPDGYLSAVRQLCDHYGCLLILDEVQTGMGRTGKMFAFEHWGVSPDILCLGKAFGGGIMPTGAVMAGPRAWKPLTDNPILHSTTFGGNPLACAAAIATVHVLLEEDLPRQAAEKGEFLRNELLNLKAAYPLVISDVRGMGLMLGIEFHANEIGYAVAKGMFERNVLVAGTYINSKVIRVEPPLTITYEELETVLIRLRATLEVVNFDVMKGHLRQSRL